MPVTLKDVEHVAELARLAFTPEEKVRLMDELNTVLAYMEQLNRLDTTHVEPLAQVISLANVFREDVRVPGVDREAALRNAPARSEAFFKVPKVPGGH